jgi:SAM-dependent methyltransferase
MRAVMAVRPAQVAVLWNDREGHGVANATRTALLLGRGRVVPITPEGLLPVTSWWQPICGAIARAWSRTVWALGARWDALRARVEGPELEPPVWHSHYLAVEPSTRAMTELAARLRGRVLDIGAGTGYAARFLDPAETTYLPTDLPTGRDSADPTISLQATRPRVYCAGQRLPFRDNSVDGVLSSSVLEHVVDVHGILRDAFRVVRPGGRVLIGTPFFFPFHGEPDDFRRWTVYGLTEELRACGFEVEATRRIGSSLATLVLNLHMVVKYEWRTADSPLLRFISRWAWPLVLVWQALTNGLASWSARFEPDSRMPLGVAIVARRPEAV